MNEKLRKLRRILAVQTQLARLARWQCAELRAQQAQLGDEQSKLLNWLYEDIPAAALLSSAVTRRLEMVSKELVLLAARQEAQSSRELDERRRLRGAEQLTATLEMQVSQSDLQRQSEETIVIAVKAED
ncbi:MAG TPA: hypothetical protein VEK34_10645 [Methylocella sp.]|nr:hypothetical protein [Methylocella sp.]